VINNDKLNSVAKVQFFVELTSVALVFFPVPRPFLAIVFILRGVSFRFTRGRPEQGCVGPVEPGMPAFGLSSLQIGHACRPFPAIRHSGGLRIDKMPLFLSFCRLNLFLKNKEIFIRNKFQ
jgi:hypothetical protein